MTKLLDSAAAANDDDGFAKLTSWVEQYRLGQDQTTCQLVCQLKLTRLVESRWEVPRVQEMASKFVASQAKQLANNVMKHDDFVGALSASIITKLGSRDLDKAALKQHNTLMVRQMLVDAACLITFLDTFDDRDKLVAKWQKLARKFQFEHRAVWVVHQIINFVSSLPCLLDDDTSLDSNYLANRAGQRAIAVQLVINLYCTFGRRCYSALQHSTPHLFVALAKHSQAALLEDMVVFGVYNYPDDMSVLITALTCVIDRETEIHKKCQAWQVLRALCGRWPVQFAQQFVNHSKMVTKAIEQHVCDNVRRFLIKLTKVCWSWSSWPDVGLAVLERIKMLDLPDDKHVGLFQQLLEHSVVRQAFVDAGGLKVLSTFLRNAMWSQLCVWPDFSTWNQPGTNIQEASLLSWYVRRSFPVWTRLCWLMSSVKPTKHDQYGRLAIRTMRCMCL
jgi:hypothetical protein